MWIQFLDNKYRSYDYIKYLLIDKMVIRMYRKSSKQFINIKIQFKMPQNILVFMVYKLYI